MQHDLLTQLNKVILAPKKINKPTQGYKLQLSKTVSLFKWIGSSLLYVIIFSNQKLNNQLSLLYGCFKEHTFLSILSVTGVNSTCLWKQIQIDFMHISSFSKAFYICVVQPSPIWIVVHTFTIYKHLFQVHNMDIGNMIYFVIVLRCVV